MPAQHSDNDRDNDPILTLPMIAQWLGDRMRLLLWEASGMPESHRSNQAAVGRSYDLLSEEEQRRHS